MEDRNDIESKNVLPKKRIKGIVNKSEYKSELIKRARVRGATYVNWKGKTVPATVPGENCGCKLKCFDRVKEEDRIHIFNQFFNFSTKDEQDLYLQSLISAVAVNQRRRRKPEAESSRASRQSSYKYSVITCSGKYNVCKKAFLNIHGIKQDRVRRLCCLLIQGLVPRDMRGYNVNGHNAKPESVRLAIVEHVQSFPQKILHYAQNETDEKLHVKAMHSLFNKEYPDIEVKYSYYRRIFNEQFSLSFGQSQVDSS